MLVVLVLVALVRIVDMARLVAVMLVRIALVAGVRMILGVVLVLVTLVLVVDVPGLIAMVLMVMALVLVVLLHSSSFSSQDSGRIETSWFSLRIQVRQDSCQWQALRGPRPPADSCAFDKPGDTIDKRPIS